MLYEKGLLSVLSSFGRPHISGSYLLNLMTWRDLDIYLEMDKLNEEKFFELGNKINALLKPVKMSFRNELLAKSKGLPEGLYWGIYLGDERKGAWKVDVWAVETKECKRLTEYCEALKQKITPGDALRILEIKSQCWMDPGYRRTYSSGDIYTAVLGKNVTDIEGFREYLRTVSG